MIVRVIWEIIKMFKFIKKLIYRKRICHYGCGEIGTYKFDNGFWCCSPKFQLCPASRARQRKSRLDASRITPIRNDLKEGKLKCYICGKPAKYLNARSWPLCEKTANLCPEYGNYMSKVHLKRYETSNNYFKGRKRPGHSKALLTENEFGSEGQSVYWHIKARELYHKGICTVCGKLEAEELEESGKGLHMHCHNENYTDLSKDNWKEMCHKCHARFHKNLRRKETK